MWAHAVFNAKLRGNGRVNTILRLVSPISEAPARTHAQVYTLNEKNTDVNLAGDPKQWRGDQCAGPWKHDDGGVFVILVGLDYQNRSWLAEVAPHHSVKPSMSA